MNALAGVNGMAKPKSEKPKSEGTKRYGTLIRVSDEFAQAIRDVTSFEKVSMAEFADTHLLPLVRKRYRDAVLREARRIEGGESHERR
jgi:hypothetical protein